MKDDHNFTITVTLPNTNQPVSLKVSHKDETFELELNGKTGAILNNVDNSWMVTSTS